MGNWKTGNIIALLFDCRLEIGKWGALGYHHLFILHVPNSISDQHVLTCSYVWVWSQLWLSHAGLSKNGGRPDIKNRKNFQTSHVV